MFSFGTTNSTNNLWELNADGSGLTYKETSEIESAYKELFNRIFPDLNLDPSTPAGQIITYLTEQDTATINAIQDIVNYFFLGGNNHLLDLWAYNQFRLTRKGAVKGNVTIEIIGVADTQIPKGFVVSDGNLQYQSIQDYTIGADGKLSATFEQIEASETISLASTITQIVTKIVGVDSVNNPNSSTAGSLKENDTLLYKRAIEYGSIYKNSSFKSIMASVANVNGVVKIGGYENPAKVAVQYKGVQVSANSIAIVVLGGEDGDIAQEISLSKPPGCGLDGDVEVPLLIDGKEIVYKFYRPVQKALKFEVTCIIDTFSPSSYDVIIKEAIKNYVNNLEIGATITQAEVASVCNNVTNGFFIHSVKVGTKDGGTGFEVVELGLKDLGIIADSDIIVTSVKK